MSQSFSRQTNNLWFQIYQVVRENCSSGYKGAAPRDDVMLKSVLPDDLEYMDGTMMLYNSVHPEGFTVEDGAVLFSDGINIGSCDSNSNA